MSNDNYQRWVDEILEAYEAILEKSPEEQNLIGDRVEIEMCGMKPHTLRNAASSLFPCTDQRQLSALIDSDWMDEQLSNLQYEIVQRVVMLDRAIELSRAETPNDYDEVA